ncbi:cytochrome P450 [uncultured Tateyamaria sp.]|uniref:cytochrome P450 n=1 Tax=Tateyamaria sp. 1078 TaxID=3417464 RepID=UPI00260BBACF|nr:cytochrome P450 [uncultured Tateyamaria sp.]
MPTAPIAPRTPVRVALGTKPLGIWQSLRAVRQNVLAIVPEAATRLPILSGQTGKRWHMVMDPDLIGLMLRDRLDIYPKSVVTKTLLRPAIGESLFVAEGADWRWQRRTAAPAFSHRNVTALGPVMSEAAGRCADRIGAAQGPVNMLDEMVTTTFDVIGEVTFSGKELIDRAAIHDAIEDYLTEAARISFFDIMGAPAWVPRPGRAFARQTIVKTRALADRAIEARRREGPRTTPDLLDLLMAGEDPDTGQFMTTSELRDNLLTFIVAGHETTALSLAWAMYLVAFDTNVQDRARAEAQGVLQGRTAAASDLPKLPYIRAILDEALRLYPPAGLVSRTAMAQDVLGDVDIRKGDTVMIPIYALHRSHLLWDNPDAFDPDRFLDRRAIRRFAYLPFGDGPRICIGASFALQEAVLILATLLSRLRFHTVPGHAPDPVMILTLRPEGGVWLTAEAAQ